MKVLLMIYAAGFQMYVEYSMLLFMHMMLQNYFPQLAQWIVKMMQLQQRVLLFSL